MNTNAQLNRADAAEVDVEAIVAKLLKDFNDPKERLAAEAIVKAQDFYDGTSRKCSVEPDLVMRRYHIACGRALRKIGKRRVEEAKKLLKVA